MQSIKQRMKLNCKEEKYYAKKLKLNYAFLAVLLCISLRLKITKKPIKYLCKEIIFCN